MPITHKNLFSTLFLVCLSLFAQSSAYAAPETPSSLFITGTISSGNSGYTPKADDIILAVRPDKPGQIEATGSVINESGTFSILIEKYLSFNGTNLTLLINNKEMGHFQLIQANAPLEFKHMGGFFPATKSFTLNVGKNVKKSSQTKSILNTKKHKKVAKTAHKNQSPFDVNHDDIVNQDDISLIKQAVIDNNNAQNFDVNKDAVVNTRDIIDALKYLKSPASR